MHLDLVRWRQWCLWMVAAADDEPTMVGVEAPSPLSGEGHNRRRTPPCEMHLTKCRRLVLPDLLTTRVAAGLYRGGGWCWPGAGSGGGEGIGVCGCFIFCNAVELRGRPATGPKPLELTKVDPPLLLPAPTPFSLIFLLFIFFPLSV